LLVLKDDVVVMVDVDMVVVDELVHGNELPVHLDILQLGILFPRERLVDILRIQSFLLRDVQHAFRRVKSLAWEPIVSHTLNLWQSKLFIMNEFIWIRAKGHWLLQHTYQRLGSINDN
jgi:hypothetical protein